MAALDRMSVPVPFLLIPNAPVLLTRPLKVVVVAPSTPIIGVAPTIEMGPLRVRFPMPRLDDPQVPKRFPVDEDALEKRTLLASVWAVASTEAR